MQNFATFRGGVEGRRQHVVGQRRKQSSSRFASCGGIRALSWIRVGTTRPGLTREARHEVPSTQILERRTSSGAAQARFITRATLEKAPDLANSRKILKLHLSDSTISIPLESASVLEMKQATLKVFELFKEKETWERPRRLDQIKMKLSTSDESIQISLFVNPNAYATAFQAKVLFGLKSVESGIELTTEIPLSKFKDDVDNFLKSTS